MICIRSSSFSLFLLWVDVYFYTGHGTQPSKCAVAVKKANDIPKNIWKYLEYLERLPKL